MTQAASTSPCLDLSRCFTRHQQLLGGADDRLGQQDGALRGVAGVEHLDLPGAAVDQVHHVVEPRGQHVDVFAVERRDEGPVEPGHHLVGDVVRLVLQSLDGLHDGEPAVHVGAEEHLQLLGGFDVEGGDLGEEIEEAFVPRQEAHCNVPVKFR